VKFQYPFLIGLCLTLFILSQTFDSAYAKTYSVGIPTGTSIPGCEETNQCFSPSTITIKVGDKVTWSNDDTVDHTVTSGNAAGGPDGIFDTSLFLVGGIFSNTFNEAGTYDYYCMVHPWMVGVVNVESSSQTSPTGSSINVEGFSVSYQIAGGSVSNITPYRDANSLIIQIFSSSNGQLTITLPRGLIDSKIGSDDDGFFVLADGAENDFDETKTSKDRTLTIPFRAGVDEIEIIGTGVFGNLQSPTPAPTPTSTPAPTPAPTLAPTLVPTPVSTQNDDLSEIIEENKKLREELERQGEQIDELNQDVDWLKQIIQSIQGFFW